MRRARSCHRHSRRDHGVPDVTTPRRLAAASLIVALAGCATPTPYIAPPPPAPPAAGTARGDEAAEVARLINQHRARIAGCPQLAWDDAAAHAAQAHAADMARRGYFSHVSPEGGNVGSRLTAAGARWRAVGENIAKGQPSAVIVVRDWLSSSGHRANIENCVYTRHGIAHAGDLWVHVFYTPIPGIDPGTAGARSLPDRRP